MKKNFIVVLSVLAAASLVTACGNRAGSAVPSPEKSSSGGKGGPKGGAANNQEAEKANPEDRKTALKAGDAFVITMKDEAAASALMAPNRVIVDGAMVKESEAKAKFTSANTGLTYCSATATAVENNDANKDKIAKSQSAKSMAASIVAVGEGAPVDGDPTALTTISAGVIKTVSKAADGTETATYSEVALTCTSNNTNGKAGVITYANLDSAFGAAAKISAPAKAEKEEKPAPAAN